MEVVFTFFLGMFVGSAMFIMYGIYQMRKLKMSRENLLNEIKKKAEQLEQKTNSIKDRLVQASKIATAQMELRAQIEMPSKNALHSKYKGDLISELQDMEHRKLDILRTVLAEGFDPMITILNDNGSKQEVPLSTYVATAQQTVDAATGVKTPPPPPTDDGQPKKFGKFFLYKGGKDDGTTH